MKAAEETLGERKCKSDGKRSKCLVQRRSQNPNRKKRHSYLQYRNKTITYNKYKEVRNRVNEAIQKIKRDFWEKFSADMEYDLHGAQKRVWNMLRNRKKHVNEFVQIIKITSKKQRKNTSQTYIGMETETKK